jgi:hypothetical protein
MHLCKLLNIIDRFASNRPDVTQIIESGAILNPELVRLDFVDIVSE